MFDKDFMLMTTYAVGKKAVEKVSDLIEEHEASLDEETKQKRDEARQLRKEKWTERLENLQQTVVDYHTQWVEKQAEKERQRKAAYDEEYAAIRRELPIKSSLYFRKGSYISGAMIDSPCFRTKLSVKGKVLFGKRTIELYDDNKKLIMTAEEDKAKYNLSGKWRETVFEMSCGGYKKASAGMKVDGLNYYTYMLPYGWKLTKERGNFPYVARDQEGNLKMAAGPDYDREDRLIVQLKDEETCLAAFIMLFVFLSYMDFRFSESYDRYVMRSVERNVSG